MHRIGGRRKSSSSGSYEKSSRNEELISFVLIIFSRSGSRRAGTVNLLLLLSTVVFVSSLFFLETDPVSKFHCLFFFFFCFFFTLLTSLLRRVHPNKRIESFAPLPFWLKPFPVRTCAVLLLRHELFWFGLFQVSATQFCSFPPLLMASVGDGTDVPISPLPATSSNFGSHNGSAPDLERTSIRRSTMEDKINEMFLQFAELPLPLQSVSRFGNRVQTLSQTVATCCAKLANAEQIVSSPRSLSCCTGNNFSFRLKRLRLAKLLEFTWTETGSLGSHGPGSFDDNRNTRRRLDSSSSPEDEHARSVFLAREILGNDPTHLPSTRPTRIHCKT